MAIDKTNSWLRVLGVLPLVLLAGCAQRGLGSKFWMLDPKGIISATQVYYLKLDVFIMLLIIVPTTILIIWVMRRYRGNGGKGHYDAQWDHSNAIEMIVWGIPILTVGVLGYFSIKAIYAVNPYSPSVITHAIHVSHQKDPLEIDVIATDWQWVFIYPKQHIATVDRLVIPAGVPVHFRLTSATVVNDFYIPQLVGMIDVMPGMRVKQVLIATQLGRYQGFSANYSGAGFSWMDFRTQSLTTAQFRQWVHKIQGTQQHLTYAAFDTVAQPNINVNDHVSYFSHVQSHLFTHVIDDTLAGKTYPTPMAMTENMTKYLRHRE